MALAKLSTDNQSFLECLETALSGDHASDVIKDMIGCE